MKPTLTESALHWGVLWSGAMRQQDLISTAHSAAPRAGTAYQGEPVRALLFTSRSAARAWCDKVNARWKADESPVVRQWRATPVRVREVTQVVPPTKLRRSGMAAKAVELMGGA